MKKTLWHVILSAAKNLVCTFSIGWRPQILRGAQNDMSKPLFNGICI